MVYQNGAAKFAPTSPALYNNPALIKRCGGEPDGKVAVNWVACKLPPEHENFRPFLYSADLLLPFVSFNQAKSWGPTAEAGFIKAATVIEILFGWASNIFVVAYFSGVIRR